ncbi:MAG: hypothetical protein Q9213_000626 [Squamulea squamosa]
MAVDLHQDHIAEEHLPHDMEDHHRDATGHHHLPGEAPHLEDTVVDQLFLEIATSTFTDRALIPDQDQGHTRHDHAVLRPDEEVEATGVGKRPHHLLVVEEEEGVRAIRATRATATVVAAGIEVGAGTEEIDSRKRGDQSRDG